MDPPEKRENPTFMNPPPLDPTPDDYDNQVVDDDDEKDTKKKGMCRKVLKFCFSHIGLSGMVVAYAVAGGFIFEHLEQTNEKQDCVKKMNKFIPFANETVSKLYQIAENFQDDTYKEDALIVSIPWKSTDVHVVHLCT